NARAHGLLAGQKNEPRDTLKANKSANPLNPLSLPDLARLLEIKGIQEAKAIWTMGDSAFPTLEKAGISLDAGEATKLLNESSPVSDARATEMKPNLLVGERNRLETERSSPKRDDLWLSMEGEGKNAQRLEKGPSESTEFPREVRDIPSGKMGKEPTS